MADLSNLRTSYQNVLAEQLKKGLGQVGNVYASRGTTGGGEEAYAVGQLGQQYGQGVAQNELALQQFGEQQRQFDVGQGNWGQQFGLQKELGLGGLDLQKQQLAQSGNQFGQSLAEQVAQRQQQGSQFGQSLAQNAGQFGQSLAEQVAQRQQQGSQFGQSLAQNAGQFGQSLAEQVAQRQQQGSQFGQSLAQSGSQFGQQMEFNKGVQLGQFNTGQNDAQIQAIQARIAQNPMLQREFAPILDRLKQGNIQQTLAGQQQQASIGDTQRLDEIARANGLNSGTDLTLMAQYDNERYNKILANYYNKQLGGYTRESNPVYIDPSTMKYPQYAGVNWR